MQLERLGVIEGLGLRGLNLEPQRYFKLGSVTSQKMATNSCVQECGVPGQRVFGSESAVFEAAAPKPMSASGRGGHRATWGFHGDGAQGRRGTGGRRSQTLCAQWISAGIPHTNLLCSVAALLSFFLRDGRPKSTSTIQCLSSGFDAKWGGPICPGTPFPLFSAYPD